MKKLSKKGQLQILAPSVLALVFAAIVLVFGLIMIQETRDTDVITNAATSTIANELISPLNDTAQTLAVVGSQGANGFTVVNVTNRTSGVDVPSTNYTFSSTGTIQVTSGSFNGTNINVTYTYVHGDEAWDSANLTISGMGTFADFWEIIVLAIVISIVIGLLLITFGRSGTR